MTSRSDALFAAVRADPDDNAVRAVLADHLQERGDPRGELIAIQLAHTDRRMDLDTIKRVHALVQQHGAAWSGPLAAVCSRIVFRAGFPSAIQIHPHRTSAWPACADDPVLETVERLDGRMNAKLAGAVLRAPALRALRAITLDADPILEPLEERAPASLRAVRGIEWKGRGAPYRARWTERVIPLLARLTNVTEVTITEEILELVLASPVIARLHRVAMWAFDARSLPALLARLPANVTSVSAQNVTLARSSSGLTCTAAPFENVLLTTPLDAIAAMPRHTRIQISGPVADALAAGLAERNQPYVRLPEPTNPNVATFEPRHGAR